MKTFVIEKVVDDRGMLVIDAKIWKALKNKEAVTLIYKGNKTVYNCKKATDVK